MEYKNTFNVAKVIACVLIVSILMESVAAAPVPDDTPQSPPKPNNPKKRGNQNHRGKKNLGNNQFAKIDDETWKNACNSIGWVQNEQSEQNQNTTYQTTKSSLELQVQNLKSSMQRMDKINTTKIKEWEEFNNQNYTFLPIRPTGIALKWHQDTQIFLGSFSLLYEFQKEQDKLENSNEISEELKKILDHARTLLCEIEHFVNVTSNKNGKQKLNWFEKKDMGKIVKFQKHKYSLNNLFVKTRFQQYIDKLQKRIEHFKLEKNVEPKALKSQLRPRKMRKNNKHRRRTTTVAYTGEPTTTEKTFIITTKKPRKNPRNTRLPGQQKKHNRSNQKLQ